jgi:AcrR family transcriptional regulator
MARAGLSREAVTRAALDIIDRSGPQGFEGLTLASVAAEAGVSAPSLYKHIGSLADLRREVAIASVRHLTEVLQDATIGRAGEDAIAALAHAIRGFARRYPGRYAASQRAGNPDEPADADLIAAGTRSVDVIAGALRGYRLSPEQKIDAIRALRSAIHGFVLLESGGGFGLARDLDASFDTVTRMLTRSLAELDG